MRRKCCYRDSRIISKQRRHSFHIAGRRRGQRTNCKRSSSNAHSGAQPGAREPTAVLMLNVNSTREALLYLYSQETHSFSGMKSELIKPTSKGTFMNVNGTDDRGQAFFLDFNQPF